MTLRGKRRVTVFRTHDVWFLPDGGSLVWQEAEQWGTTHCRVVDTGNGDILWRSRIRCAALSRIPIDDWRGVVVSILAKLAAKREELKGQAGAALAGADPLWPSLFELLTADKFPDGTKREPSRLTVFMDSGAVKAALRDEGMQASAFRSGATIGAALDALERALREDDPDLWQPWRAGNQQWKKKGK